MPLDGKPYFWADSWRHPLGEPALDRVVRQHQGRSSAVERRALEDLATMPHRHRPPWKHEVLHAGGSRSLPSARPSVPRRSGMPPDQQQALRLFAALVGWERPYGRIRRTGGTRLVLGGRLDGGRKRRDRAYGRLAGRVGAGLCWLGALWAVGTNGRPLWAPSEMGVLRKRHPAARLGARDPPATCSSPPKRDAGSLGGAMRRDCARVVSHPTSRPGAVGEERATAWNVKQPAALRYAPSSRLAQGPSWRNETPAIPETRH